MKTPIRFIGLLAVLMACQPAAPIPPAPNSVIPSPQQLAYQPLELIGFIHFGMNTFTNKEWGYGDEDPAIFNPVELDAEQWALTAKAAGMKELILTAKHHDGFCLWPSAYTEHSVKNSPYKDGKGDIVREFVDACRKHGLKAGLYLSPWDRNHADYGTPAYIDYYRQQLEELLTQYGEINEIWVDGANGGDGYYGGANEIRKIDRSTYYDWPTSFELIKGWQPDVKVFSDAGPDIHWIGNEHGFAGETFWSMIEPDSLVIGASNPAYLNAGDPDGREWIVGQCDVSIRPGWFYHPSQDTAVKTVEQLLDIYYKSVGRNAILLLNLPPDTRGLIHENDVDSLKQFKAVLDATFAQNLTKGAIASATQQRQQHPQFAPAQVLDASLETYWAVDTSRYPVELTLELPEARTFDRILLQEPIQLGQRISAYQIQIKKESGWETVHEGTTIGYKGLVRMESVEAMEIKIILLDGNNTPALARVAVYRSPDS